MDQIVFIFDLESFLPSVLEEVDDSYLESTLCNVKKALLRILTHGRVLERRRDLSSFGFRFYSSTDYFSLPPQITGDWHDLCLASWDRLEDALRARLDSVLAAVTRAGLDTRGRRGAGSGLCRALEEVTALYSWDRPALFSPIKTGAKYEVRFGNSVFVVTRLPADSDQLHQFLDSAGGKQVKPRDILESISSKRVKAAFTGELNISLHIINAVEGPIEGNVVQLFHKALKDLKGGVLQLSSLGSFSRSREESMAGSEPLVQRSRDLGHVPATCVLASHVLESSLPGKLVDRSHYGRGEVRLQDTSLQLEFVSSCDLGLAGVAALGLVEVSSVTSLASSCWRQWACVWAADHGTTLASVLAFLHHTGQCLVLEDPMKQILVMFHNSAFTAVIGRMDRVESHFYHRQLSNTFSVPVIPNNEEVQLAIEESNVEPLKFSPIKKVKKVHPRPFEKFDTSALESWRVSDTAAKGFVEELKEAELAGAGQHGSQLHKLMLGVRESYTARSRGTRAEAEKSSKMDRKPSALSNASTASAGSGGAGQAAARARKSLSRGEMLREMSGLNRTCAGSEEETGAKKDAAENILNDEKESMIAAKTNAAADFEARIGDHGANTDSLIDTLDKLMEEVTKEADDVVLAGFSEACISVLLKHLDTSGVSKASLEDVVTSRLLLDVASVARLAGEDLALRSARHKVQVLLRAEVHWLLASRARQEEYEEAILSHLRQVTLHAGHQTMLEFLSSVLTQVYVDRQPDLVCLLYDELEQERPGHLLNIFSPVRSHAPSSVRSTSSALGSAAPNSANSMHPPAVVAKPNSNKSNNLSRSFRGRPKSFDTSLTSRQIDLAAGSRRQERKGGKVVTTGRMAARSRLSTKKKLLASKSPKKTKQMVKRNLNFEDGRAKSPCKGAKSPRKNVSVMTPSKSRKVKFTPGKRHRLLCPETPSSKVARRKSDGNTSVAETPEKMMTVTTPRRQQASLALRRKASFYNPKEVSRSVQRFEDSQNASMIVGNTSTMDMNSSVFDTSGNNDSGQNKSHILFAHIINKKRKLDDSAGPMGDNEGSSQSPLRKVRKKLNSFLESSDRPFESTRLGGTQHLDQHLGGVGFNISNIQNKSKTPVKNPTTPIKGMFMHQDEMFSPSKRVNFNLKPQPPTPKSGVKAKSILKTPSKDSPRAGAQSPQRSDVFKTPSKTPSKAVSRLVLSPCTTSPLATHCSSRLTPAKVTPRRDIGQASTRSISVTTPTKQTEGSEDSPPASPIITSSKKRRNVSTASTNTVANLHGFDTPSPRTRTKSSALSTVHEYLLSEDSQSPRPPICQDHFQPPLMSTLTPGAKKYFKEPAASFKPCFASTEKDVKLPLKFPPVHQASGRTTPDFLTKNEAADPMSTQDIINSTTVVNMSSTLIKPSDKVSAKIFESSALYPPNLSTTIVPLAASPDPATTPPQLEMTPVKADTFAAEHELELVSPAKRVNIQNIVRSLDIDDGDEAEHAGRSAVRFVKTDSEQSVATSLDRISPEPNPSSGYSSEPQAEAASPDSLCDPDSQCQVQVSSPLKQEEENKKVRKLSRELGGLQDLMSPYFSVEGSSRRVNSKFKSELVEEKKSVSGKRKRDSQVTEKVAKIKTSLSEGNALESGKKSSRTKFPTFYKELDSEDSQTDEDELAKMVEERFGLEMKKIENKTLSLPNSGLILRSPARFKCKYCGAKYRSKKDLKVHEMKELDERMEKKNIEEKVQRSEESNDLEETTIVIPQQEDNLIKKAEPEIAPTNSNDMKTPKLVTELQDQLSSYFSPSSSNETRSRKTTQRLSDAYTLAQATLTPRSSKPQSRSLVRTRTLLQEAATSTPNDDLPGSGRRAARQRPVSYAEFPDFDTSASDLSCGGGESATKAAPARRFLLASVRRSSISPNTSLISNDGSRKLVVKDLNDSQEIQDIARAVRPSSPRPGPSPLTTPDMSQSPSKYTSAFSVTQRIETPSGQIKLKINRTAKPHQSTPLTTKKSGKGSDSQGLRSLIIPRLNRSACKEMGLSPNKLVSILTSTTPQKPSVIAEVATPEKENKPVDTCTKLRKENEINKTPRIRIKKVPSRFGSEASNWEAEQILSPHKSRSPVKSALPDLSESPARTFSPLSTVSVYNLTKSPIINTQVEGGKKSRRGKVNKQLKYKN